MPSLNVVCLMAAATYAAPVLAAEPAAEDHVIIVAGSKLQADAEKDLERVRARWPAQVQAKPGYPQVVNTDGRPGLNPGFVVVLAGVCPDAQGAAAARNELRKTFPGTYVRKVPRSLPGTTPVCPEVLGKGPAKRPAKAAKGYQLVAEGVADATAATRWRIFSGKAECGRASDGNVIVQLLDGGGALIAERRELADCVKGDPDVDGSGKSKLWSATIVKRDETRAYVLLTHESWVADTGCNGGEALCPRPDRMASESLTNDQCNSASYELAEDESHCWPR